MNIRTLFSLVTILVLAASSGLALNPDDELWIPAAARGAGNGDSDWITDLYVMNLGEEAVTVEITWLERFADNSEAEGSSFVIDGGATLVLDDVIMATFGKEAATGAIHIEVEGDEDKAAEEDEAKIVANARIYSIDADGATMGQGFEGLTSTAAIAFDQDSELTHVIGVSMNEAFRSNFYGLNISMDDETDEAEAAEVLVEILDEDGEVFASKTYSMEPLSPIFYPVSDLGGGDFENGTLRFTMTEGSALFGVSKIDQKSNDPTTLEAHWECDDNEDASGEDFTDQFFIDDCTFTPTGRNTFWVLEPGYELVFTGEEDGEQIDLTITVLDETFMVDGIETRIVEEYEQVDGEVEEISRNYFAICEETNSVFYFGEHVDIYEDGVVVSHDGEWLAGEDGAQAGIIMPGTVLLGSRYMQEIAPGIAMDRADHVDAGIDLETEAGSFSDCIRIDETSPLEPGHVSIKYYCPGVGLVIDSVVELVSYTK